MFLSKFIYKFFAKHAPFSSLKNVHAKNEEDIRLGTRSAEHSLYIDSMSTPP